MNNQATFDAAESSNAGFTMHGQDDTFTSFDNPLQNIPYSEGLPELFKAKNNFNLVARWLVRLGHTVSRLPSVWFTGTPPNEDGWEKRGGGVDVNLPPVGEIPKSEAADDRQGPFTISPLVSMQGPPNPSTRYYPLTFFHCLFVVNIATAFLPLVTDPVLQTYGLLPEVGLPHLHAMLDRISRDCGILVQDIDPDVWNLELIFLMGFRLVNLPFLIRYPIPLVLRTGEFVWVLTKIQIDTWLIQAAHPDRWERFGVRNRNHDYHQVHKSVLVLHPFLSRPSNPKNRAAGPLEWSSLYFNREVPLSGIAENKCRCVCTINPPPEALALICQNSDVMFQRRDSADQNQTFEFKVQMGNSGESGEPSSSDDAPVSSAQIPEVSDFNSILLSGLEAIRGKADSDLSIAPDMMGKLVDLAKNENDHRQAKPATNTAGPSVVNSSTHPSQLS